MKKFGSAVILAGGKSSRMGFDKKNMVIDDEPLLVSMVKKLRGLFDEIILITNSDNNLDILYMFDKISKDTVESSGPLSGIYTGLELANSKYVYFIACDMPIINEDYIAHMKNCINFKDCEAIVTKSGEWIEPFNAFYLKDISSKIKEALNMNKKSINALVEGLNTIYVSEEIARSYSHDFEMFFNLNTKDDIKEFISRLRKDK